LARDKLPSSLCAYQQLSTYFRLFYLALYRAFQFQIVGHKPIPVFCQYGINHGCLVNSITDLTTLRHKFSVSAHGSTLKQVMDTASKLHLSSRALKLDIDHLEQLQTPCILHWEMKHFVVLKKVAGNKVIIHDPGVGERVFTIEEVNKLFTGVALELTPSPAFEKNREKKHLV
jgi:ABC-type bacteriocin/lantibiotic exporter with double-glycine peptidase domain